MIIGTSKAKTHDVVKSNLTGDSSQTSQQI